MPTQDQIMGKTTLSSNRRTVGYLFPNSEGENFFISPSFIEHVTLLQSASILGWMYRKDLAKETKRAGIY